MPSYMTFLKIGKLPRMDTITFSLPEFRTAWKRFLKDQCKVKKAAKGVKPALKMRMQNAHMWNIGHNYAWLFYEKAVIWHTISF